MHEVKIYDGKGNLKRKISPKEICEKINILANKEIKSNFSKIN